jgi:hypothetical protein
MDTAAWEKLTTCLDLGSVLDELRCAHGGYELLFHHQQGEFHHDVAIRVHAPEALPAPVLVVATNCNGGVKELLALDEVPSPQGLWHWRCPDSPEFSGEAIALKHRSETLHWFPPCELLTDGARSELRPEWRERQAGGGWTMRSCAVPTERD